MNNHATHMAQDGLLLGYKPVIFNLRGIANLPKYLYIPNKTPNFGFPSAHFTVYLHPKLSSGLVSL